MLTPNRLMIRFTQDETQPDWHGYFYTVLFFLNALVLSLLKHQYFNYVNIVGMRIKTAVIAAVYNKVFHYTDSIPYLQDIRGRKHV